MLSALTWINKTCGFCSCCTATRVLHLVVLHCANSICSCPDHAGAQRSTDPPPVKHAVAASQACRHGALPGARDSCSGDTNAQSGSSSLYPILCSHLAQEQQCSQAVAAAASTPQASTYQQLRIQTSTADHHAANHDSFRMLSNAMASCPAATQSSPRPPMRSIQPPSHPSIHSKLASRRKRAAATAQPAAPQVVDQGRSDSFTAEVPYFTFSMLQCSAATPPS